MRHLAIIGLTFTLASLAHAQDRSSMHIDVKPRSWLDAGSEVLVGSMQNYMYDTQSMGSVGGARYSNQGLLPDRFSGGRPVTMDIGASEFFRR